MGLGRLPNPGCKLLWRAGGPRVEPPPAPQPLQAPGDEETPLILRGSPLTQASSLEKAIHVKFTAHSRHCVWTHRGGQPWEPGHRAHDRSRLGGKATGREQRDSHPWAGFFLNRKKKKGRSEAKMAKHIRWENGVSYCCVLLGNKIAFFL